MLSFFKTSPWGKKELFQLLFLVLVLIPLFIEYLLMNYLTNLFQNDLYSGTLIGFIMSIIFMTGLYVVALRPKQLGWREVGLNRFSRSYWGPIIGWTVVLIIGSILMVFLMSFVGIGVDNSKTESVQTHLSPLTFFIAFVSACIISPVYEEIFYRGFLYRWFRSRYGLAFGMIGSSFIFMLVHIPNYNVLPVTFVSGLLFSWTYEKTGSVFPGMIIHGAFNAIALFLTAFA
ncbi:CAAX amino protease [Sporosarcina newyorkensis 2681]|uniref:CAAX amino protease n=1 Tax=Sporosarcina newyorkensis 2681 TaxID=1027292 RepID=F9DWD5_9BACL|nr:type II CAAX endopeptidase family protein [Sporosarcina newyorkensis]EGQ21756.1 CAAX amino protease [Sporosarcina newyorkensis 2681]